MSDKDIKIKLGIVDNVSSEISKVSNSIRGFSDKTNGYLKTLTAGFVGLKVAEVVINGVKKAINLLKNELIESYKAFKSSEESIARLNGSLKATGQDSRFTSAELQGLSSHMQKLTLNEDDATNKLISQGLVFKNISREVFPEFIKASLDIGASTGNNESAMEALGIALERPSVGIRKLRTEGILLSKEREDEIKELEATGNLYEAQKILLDEVAARYKGYAEELANTPTGKITQLQNNIGDIKEAIGVNMVAPTKLWYEILLAGSKILQSVFDPNMLQNSKVADIEGDYQNLESDRDKIDFITQQIKKNAIEIEQAKAKIDKASTTSQRNEGMSTYGFNGNVEDISEAKKTLDSLTKYNIELENRRKNIVISFEKSFTEDGEKSAAMSVNAQQMIDELTVKAMNDGMAKRIAQIELNSRLEKEKIQAMYDSGKGDIKSPEELNKVLSLIDKIRDKSVKAETNKGYKIAPEDDYQKAQFDEAKAIIDKKVKYEEEKERLQIEIVKNLEQTKLDVKLSAITDPIEKEIALTNLKYDAMLAKAEEYDIDIKQIEEARKLEFDRIEDEKSAKVIEAEKQRLETYKEYGRQIINTSIQIGQNVIGSLMSKVDKEKEKDKYRSMMIANFALAHGAAAASIWSGEGEWWTKLIKSIGVSSSPFVEQGIALKNLNKYASGDNYISKSGPAIVGENGPEIRWLNRGDSITNNRVAKNINNESSAYSFTLQIVDNSGNLGTAFTTQLRNGQMKTVERYIDDKISKAIGK